MVDDQQVEALKTHFESVGWGYNQLKKDTFRLGFEGENGTYLILIRVTEYWIVFSINPYLKKEKKEWGANLFQILLELNDKIPLAKFSIDEDGDIALTVDMPSVGFSAEKLRKAVTTLGSCADQLLIPVLQSSTIEQFNRAHLKRPKVID